MSIVPSTNAIAPAITKEVAKAEGAVAASGTKAGAGYAAGLGGALKGAAKLFAPLAAAAGVVGVGKFFGDAIKGASALQQSVGGVEAVFKGQAAAIKAASAEASQNLGLSKNAYNEMATVLGAMLKNQGLRDFTGQTQRLIGVGADLAAQFGGSTREAVEALAAAMRGESDPIERYGISLNETAVKAELAAMGSDKLKGAALEQAKAQARINIIMRQSADAQGAFAREADTAAGKQQRLAASWENFKSAIGGALLPVLSRVLDVLAAVGVGVTQLWGAMSGGDSVLSRVQAAFAALVQSPVGQWFTALVKDIAGVLSPALAEVAQLVTGTVWPAMQALGQVWVTVAKGYLTFAGAILGSPVGQFLTTLLKGAIVGFFVGVKDVFVGLVKIVSGAWDAIAGLLTGDWARMWSGLGQVVVGAVQALWGFLQAGLMGRVLGMFRGFIAATGLVFGGFGAFMSGLFRGLLSGFIEFGGTLGKLAGSVITPAIKGVGAVFGLLKGLADTAIGGVVSAFTALGSKITGALKLSDDAMRAFGSAVQGVWTTVVGAITGAWQTIFGGVLTPMRATLVGTLLAAWNGFRDTISRTWQAVTAATSAAWSSITVVFTTLRTWLTATLVGAWNGFRTLVAAVWAAVSSAISTGWSRVLAIFTTLRTWVASTLTGMWNTFRALVAAVWNAQVTSISNAWTRILGVFTTLRTWVTSTLASAWNTLKTNTANAWTAITTSIGNAWTKISGYFTNLKTGVNQVWDFFEKAVTGISKAWSGLTTAIQGPINSAKSWINTNLVGKMNATLKTVGVSLTIPGLATGGIWNGPGSVTRAASGAVLPGYTPGRDVHQFYSPTGGRLMLSGGEAVMVPEWTRAVGPRLVAMMNAIARRGGANAIRRFLFGTTTQPTVTNRGMSTEPRYEYARGGILGAQRFAGGGILDILTDPVGAIKGLASGILNSMPGGGFAWETLKGFGQKIAGGVADKVKAFWSSAAGAIGGGGSGAVMGWKRQWAWAQANLPGVRLHSGLRPGARTRASGNVSYHALGRAIDITPSMPMFNKIKGTFFSNIRELIFSPANGQQVHNGRNHYYSSPITRADHWNHIHWAMRRGGVFGGRGGAKLFDNGGLLRRGDIAVHDAAKPDRVLTDAQWRAVMRHLPISETGDVRGRGGAGVTINGDVFGDPERFARQITTRMRDELVLADLAGV